MKAIIIDDEKHVREGLVLLANWHKFGIDTIFEAQNGEEAKKIISEHQPEIIFTDMRMPKADGISLLKWIHASGINSKTIVISGHDDFEYMRNAIFYKSFDYLLKPIDPDVLNETLARAVHEWHEQARLKKSMADNNRVMNEVQPIYWDHVLSNLLGKGNIPNSVIEKCKKEFAIELTKQKMTVALLSVKPHKIKYFHRDEELAFFSLKNICNELLRKHNTGVSFRNINGEDELVLLIWNQKCTRSIIKEIITMIYQFTTIHSFIAIGQTFYQVADAYESAKHVLLKHNLLEQTNTGNLLTPESVNNRPCLHLLDYAEEIKWAIQSGSMEKMDEILNRMYDTFPDSHNLSFEQIELWKNEFEILKKHWLKEYNVHDQLENEDEPDFWNEDGRFSFTKFKRETRKEFHHLIKNLMDVKYQKEKNSIEMIAEYLRNHYQKEINLQEIAERFFLSKEYISRKFKQAFNETITDYLMKIRMEKAMELLKNPHLKIYEIASQVGYQNEKYFSKSFKKFMGMTP